MGAVIAGLHTHPMLLLDKPAGEISLSQPGECNPPLDPLHRPARPFLSVSALQFPLSRVNHPRSFHPPGFEPVLCGFDS